MKDENEIVTINSLPTELRLNIFSFLNHKNLARSAQVCKLWKRDTADNQFWTKQNKYKNKQEYIKYIFKKNNTKNLSAKHLFEKPKNKNNFKKILINLAVMGGKKASFANKLAKERVDNEGYFNLNVIHDDIVFQGYTFRIWQEKNTHYRSSFQSLMNENGSVIVIFSDEKEEIELLLKKIKSTDDKILYLMTSSNIELPSNITHKFTKIFQESADKPVNELLTSIHDSLREMAASAKENKPCSIM